MSASGAFTSIVTAISTGRCSDRFTEICQRLHLGQRCESFVHWISGFQQGEGCNVAGNCRKADLILSGSRIPTTTRPGWRALFQGKRVARMLVLTRGIKQSIVINGGLVTVTVLEVKGGRVRLGIEAPADVQVQRSEILETGSESK